MASKICCVPLAVHRCRPPACNAPVQGLARAGCTGAGLRPAPPQWAGAGLRPAPPQWAGAGLRPVAPAPCGPAMAQIRHIFSIAMVQIQAMAIMAWVCNGVNLMGAHRKKNLSRCGHWVNSTHSQNKAQSFVAWLAFDPYVFNQMPNPLKVRAATAMCQCVLHAVVVNAIQ